ncbi:MAG: VanW family protein [Actinomycetota bacterium]|nr:VanW family protein [Actinomycetota bacterium]
MRSYSDLPRPARLALFAVVALFALSALALLALRLTRSGALPGTTVAGVDVGGLDEGELRRELRDIEIELGSDRLTISRDDGDTAEVTTTGAEMGYEIDAIETADAVLERGRQVNPLAAFIDHLTATFGTISIEPFDELDGDAFAAWQGESGATLGTAPFPGGIEFTGTNVEPLYPEPGVVLETDELREKSVGATRSPGEDSIVVSTERADPLTNEADVDGVVGEAEIVVAGPITLERPNGELTITPRELTGILEVVLIEGEAELELRVKPKALDRAVGGRAAELETEPIDAGFELTDAGVNVVPSVEGFSFAPKRAALQVLKAATTKNRTAILKGVTEPAEFTTKDAKRLDISEQVSSFTTYHACCEARVTNIHVIADLLDGAVVQPGESFSLNDFVGPRTEAKGFIGAPAIRDGEFVEEIGGGISQFATTFFNAIFFGGYDLLEYQAHSYYISRYPMGREATISTPAPDLAFLNDSNAGIYIDTSYTDTSITVSFYGNTRGEIESVSGPPHNYEQPGRECQENPSLGKKEEVVIDSGHTGFDIVVTRVFPGGAEEEFFTRYQSSPVIVERKKC